MSLASVGPLLSLSTLSSEESAEVGYLTSQLASFAAANAVKSAYYDGTNRARQLGIAIPPQMQNINTVVGWPGTVVDVLEERLDFEGWKTDDSGEDFGLGEVYRSNDLGVESGFGHLDALICGVAFVAVGAGADGEPDPLVTVESPNSMTCRYDRRTRRLASALSVTVDEVGFTESVILYLPDVTVSAVQDRGMWRVLNRDEHNLGRVPVARLVNRQRSGDPDGRSEITLAVRSYADAAVRTLMGAEVAREFYSSPQRYLLGADESAFTGPDGERKTAWETYLGRFLAIGRDEDGDLPQVGQFSASSPSPYIDQVRALAQLLAAEAGMPASYLGFTTENPASADAIRAGEARLVKRAKRRQRTFGLAWVEVARLALLVRDGAVPDGFAAIEADWTPAETPTEAAAADAATKLIAAGVLSPDSSVTYDRIGLSETEQRRLDADKRRGQGQAALAALSAAAARVGTG